MRLRFILAILLFPTCLFLLAQTRRALVVGLGQQEDRSWGKINGDKDVPYVLEMLEDVGYRKSNIITLVNEQATKLNIVTAFKRLTNSCKQRDIVYVHFSGHGQRVTDVNGDEKDGWDESWIPYDAYRAYGNMDRGEKHLIDDEIYEFLMGIKNRIGRSGKILVVVDACHSGGGTYGLGRFSYGQEIPVFGAEATVRGVFDPFVIPVKGNLKVSKSPEQWLTLSACKSYQVNHELNSPRLGILTYAIYASYKKGHVDFDIIEDFIKKNRGPLSQDPSLTGAFTNYNLSDILK